MTPSLVKTNIYVTEPGTVMEILTNIPYNISSKQSSFLQGFFIFHGENGSIPC